MLFNWFSVKGMTSVDVICKREKDGMPRQGVQNAEKFETFF